MAIGPDTGISIILDLLPGGRFENHRPHDNFVCGDLEGRRIVLAEFFATYRRVMYHIAARIAQDPGARTRAEKFRSVAFEQWIYYEKSRPKSSSEAWGTTGALPSTERDFEEWLAHKEEYQHWYYLASYRTVRRARRGDIGRTTRGQ